jgi:hypothetical protein
MKIYDMEVTMAAQPQDKLLFRYRPTDNLNGVSRSTVESLAAALGLNETQVIHYALKQLAKTLLPAYPQDDGPLTAKDIVAVQRRAGKPRGKSVSSTLI